MEDTYDDIINLPPWEPRRHPRMPLAARAAQFAPFAALNGHDDAIREAVRQTAEAVEPDDEQAAILNDTLRRLRDALPSKPLVEVTYFRRDPRKPGGEYLTHRGNLRLIDTTTRLLTFTDGTEIPLPSITDIRTPNPLS